MASSIKKVVEVNIIPQPGFQQKVWDCVADIAIIGGQAGGGKTTALVFEPLKWIQFPNFAAVFFRRDKERIRATGGLLAESKKWYVEGELAETYLKWKFPSGAQVDFEGIEGMKDLDKWLGTQIPLIVFDELPEFLEPMFWFMLSRNRGIVKKDGMILKPYCRASCNPKPGSWVARLIDWWIDEVTGFPIPERDGVLRYFFRYKDNMYWGDTPEDVLDSCPDVVQNMRKIDPSIKPKDLVKSLTFIRGTLEDNKILTKNSPEYYSSLLAMSEADQQMYLYGNWKVSSDGTDLFNFEAIKQLFKVNPESVNNLHNINNTYITCDAAKFGQDLCTIYVWSGWIVVGISVFFISDTKDICDEIEYLRLYHKVLKKNVMIDQDGLGGDVVRYGGYAGFVARRRPEQVDKSRLPENYENIKAQCYYHAADKVNKGECKFLLTNAHCRIWDRGSSKPRLSRLVKWKQTTFPIESLIAEQLQAIRKNEAFLDGGEKRLGLNNKDEQRAILGGTSPDFADPVMMRAIFDLGNKRKGLARIR